MTHKLAKISLARSFWNTFLFEAGYKSTTVNIAGDSETMKCIVNGL